jgi:hypothetical protein
MPIIVLFQNVNSQLCQCLHMQLEFVSFNEDDLDYEGYEFSVTGKLSEVRLVFLNRFIQEVSFTFAVLWNILCQLTRLLQCDLQDTSNCRFSKLRFKRSWTSGLSNYGLSFLADCCLFHGSCSSKFGLCDEAERSCIKL